MMALTATASKETRLIVCKLLGMSKPVIISKPPNRVNIKYIVSTKVGTMEKAFLPILEELWHHRSKMDRTIVYCRTYDACSTLYLYFRSSLGPEFTESVGVVDLAVQTC